MSALQEILEGCQVDPIARALLWRRPWRWASPLSRLREAGARINGGEPLALRLEGRWAPEPARYLLWVGLAEPSISGDDFAALARGVEGEGLTVSMRAVLRWGLPPGPAAAVERWANPNLSLGEALQTVTLEPARRWPRLLPHLRRWAEFWVRLLSSCQESARRLAPGRRQRWTLYEGCDGDTGGLMISLYLALEGLSHHQQDDLRALFWEDAEARGVGFDQLPRVEIFFYLSDWPEAAPP
jgi:hypothetical protein